MMITRNWFRLRVALVVFFLLAFVERADCLVGAGFARSTSKTKLPTLSNVAKKLLKKHNGNVDAASEEYFAKRMKSQPKPKHNDLIAATWDTVAAFLPVDYKKSKGKVEPYVDRRLNLISSACKTTTTATAAKLLDVGCGDGALFPKIADLGFFEYRGIDISNEMIQLGKQRFPNAKIKVGTFPPSAGEDDECYDVLVFNGSLQFFPDTANILEVAMGYLSPARGGRIVMSHVEGSKFVQQECRSNPSVAVRNLPTESQLKEWAAARWDKKKFAVEIRTKEDILLFADNPVLEEEDRSNENFYLMVLDVVPK